MILSAAPSGRRYIPTISRIVVYILCRTLGQKIYTTILLIVGIFCLVYGLLYNTFDYSRVNFYYVMSSMADQGYYLIFGITFIIKFFYDFDN